MANHNAAAAAVGYIYQTHWALLELLRQERAQSDRELTLEKHDDVAFGKGNDPEKLLQLKHHTNSKAGNLGDSSMDIWRTINVWLDDAKYVDPDGPLLVLVTTSVASEGTAAWYLRDAVVRNPIAALALLDAAARGSKSKKSANARRRWLSLRDDVRLQLVERVWVADGEIKIDEVDDAISGVLRPALPTNDKKRDVFLALVWRWWYRVALDLLLGNRTAVTAIEAYRAIESIRNSFADENLPTTVDLSDIDELDLLSEHDAKTFVHQLRIVGAGNVTLQKAVVDYHRAVAQETDWLQTTLVDIYELQDFENKVVDEWERAFARMLEDLGDDADEADQRKAGLKLFREVSESPLRIRTYYPEEFHGRGKRHELADKPSIGWHPNFKERLREITLERTSAAS